jgi:hypothetical protein
MLKSAHHFLQAKDVGKPLAIWHVLQPRAFDAAAEFVTQTWPSKCFDAEGKQRQLLTDKRWEKLAGYLKQQQLGDDAVMRLVQKHGDRVRVRTFVPACITCSSTFADIIEL